MQDLAVLFLRAGKYDDALDLLEKIREKVPTDHQFHKGQELANLNDAAVTDAYYKLMGQVELLNGAIIFDGRSNAYGSGEHVVQQVVEDMMEHYLLAVAYYYRFSGISPNTFITTTDRIYKRLSECKKDDVASIKLVSIPKWIEEYKIPKEWVSSLFELVFEMLNVK
jgi:hypothetical protein